MFKPQINVSLTSKKANKPAAEDTITETVNSIDWEHITTLAQETAKKLAVLAVVAYAAKKTIDTSSEIAIAAATSKF